MRKLNYCNIDFIDYKEAWDLQKDVLEARCNNIIDDTFFLLEHYNTYTLGKVADKNNLISTEKFLKDNQISVYEIDRGGDITYHGPGQVVGYPIINLNDWLNDTHKYLRALELVIIKTCNNYRIKAGRNKKYTGVWIGDRKIAAIGIKVKKWVTMHGFAFNVNTDLSLFNGIIPCGIEDKDVTSLKNELGKKIDIEEVKEILLLNFKEVFGYNKIKHINYNEFLQRFSVKN